MPAISKKSSYFQPLFPFHCGYNLRFVGAASLTLFLAALRNFRRAILLRDFDLLIIPSFGGREQASAEDREEGEEQGKERQKNEGGGGFVSVKLPSTSGISPRTFLLSTSSRLGLNSQFLDHTFALLFTYTYRRYIYAPRASLLELRRRPSLRNNAVWKSANRPPPVITVVCFSSLLSSLL